MIIRNLPLLRNKSRKFSSAAVTPLQKYNGLCDNKNLEFDEFQGNAVTQLNDVFSDLASGKRGARGAYMHAGVGRGKTMLMDLFSLSVTDTPKLRIHYHEFMLQIHKKLYQNGGLKDPLQFVANDIAKTTQLLCLDELEITDVADAFVTRSLFDKLWTQHGITTIFTSNCVPSGLYKGGINRDQFLPFIGLVERYCHVISLDPPPVIEKLNNISKNKSTQSVKIISGRDYRASSKPLVGTTFCTNMTDFSSVFSVLGQSVHTLNGKTQHCPASSASNDVAAASSTLNTIVTKNREFRISQSRAITVPFSIHNLICKFKFKDLCSVALGNIDYLALTEPMSPLSSTSARATAANGLLSDNEHHLNDHYGGYIALFLEDVPVLSTTNTNDTRRFINLIDILYERHILLVIHHNNLLSNGDDSAVVSAEVLKQEIKAALVNNDDDRVSRKKSHQLSSGSSSSSSPSDMFKLWIKELKLTAGQFSSNNNSNSNNGEYPYINDSSSNSSKVGTGNDQHVYHNGLVIGDIAIPDNDGSNTLKKRIKSTDASTKKPVPYADSMSSASDNAVSFTHRAIARTISRLNEMSGVEYLKHWEKKNERFVKMIHLWNNINSK